MKMKYTYFNLEQKLVSLTAKQNVLLGCFSLRNYSSQTKDFVVQKQYSLAINTDFLDKLTQTACSEVISAWDLKMEDPQYIKQNVHFYISTLKEIFNESFRSGKMHKIVIAYIYCFLNRAAGSSHFTYKHSNIMNGKLFLSHINHLLYYLPVGPLYIYPDFYFKCASAPNTIMVKSGAYKVHLRTNIEEPAMYISNAVSYLMELQPVLTHLYDNGPQRFGICKTDFFYNGHNISYGHSCQTWEDKLKAEIDGYANQLPFLLFYNFGKNSTNIISDIPTVNIRPSVPKYLKNGLYPEIKFPIPRQNQLAVFVSAFR